MEVESAGIAPASRETEIPVPQCPYAKSACFWLETGWEVSASGDASGHPMTLPLELRQVKGVVLPTPPYRSGHQGAGAIGFGAGKSQLHRDTCDCASGAPHLTETGASPSKPLHEGTR